MTHKLLAYLLGAVLGLLVALPAGAVDVAPVEANPADQPPVVQSCPVPAAINLAETSQADCCKGHKGVCGCRAGKIVCCDNTISQACTCHSDWDVAN